ncbi:SpoVG family protein [Caproiciproducens sp. CPB-2]|jgi:stage V sporulation protein G|uniref:SpoVG family protein n=1 Tax=Caproiciproducens sp. CPB-2 TaxID=3030017 RepID=UPI0023DC3944|nr:SpoVG family protein [Caproiciproducens sp. CPB-2]MDF1493702.1 SpoVG family protein [Caproiciproducens sp. CPB-2]
MAKTQTQAAEQTAPEKTAEQTPVNYDVRIFGAKSSGTQRATASVNINGAFAVRGVKVLESNKGLFVAMPQYKVGSEYKDICFPCTKESREQFNAAVMKAYEQTISQAHTQAEASAPQRTQAMSCQSM